MNQHSTVLIGRDDERQILSRILNSPAAEFVAVYGRRRVGKTYLIKTFFKDQDCIFFHITGTRDAAMSEQIHDMTQIMETIFYNNTVTIKEPENWKLAFKLLTKAIEHQTQGRRVVLFFDELPWLASKRSRFLQALDYYWNRFWSDMPQIKLIVCGSSASWMLENIISHKGGLHNRITNRIALQPFNLKESKAFIQSKGIKYSEQQIAEIFMATGGVPYYLKFLEKNLSVPQNIDQLFFNHAGFLFDEFPRLFSSLFAQPEAYEEIIRIIALKRHGIERTVLCQQAKLSTDGGRFKSRLEAFEQSGFILSFKPYGFTKKGTFYRIIDEYCLFYLHWVEPALSTLKKLDHAKGYWLEKCQTAAWKVWAGYAFEALCFKHITQIRQALNIHVSAEIGSWQYIPQKNSEENGAQIDLLFDRNDGVITLCEIKYHQEPYALTKEAAQGLMKKVAIFQEKVKTTKQIQIVLITNLPIKKTLYSEELIVENVILEDLFK